MSVFPKHDLVTWSNQVELGQRVFCESSESLLASLAASEASARRSVRRFAALPAQRASSGGVLDAQQPDQFG